MFYDLILWDDEDDPDGNYWHIVVTGGVERHEVEDVIAGHQGAFDSSDSTGHRSSSAQPPRGGISPWSSPWNPLQTCWC